MKYINNVSMLIASEECYLWKGSSEFWSTENSNVESSPVLLLEEVFRNIGGVRVAVSYVDVLPKIGEPLHYHISTVIGIVVAGKAVFRFRRKGEEEMIDVEKGDVFLIPKYAYHVFECAGEQSMQYVGLEFADQDIDYQRHRLF
jgi:quercetin dioxygenase-like cupin family protein